MTGSTPAKVPAGRQHHEARGRIRLRRARGKPDRCHDPATRLRNGLIKHDGGVRQRGHHQGPTTASVLAAVILLAGCGGTSDHSPTAPSADTESSLAVAVTTQEAGTREPGPGTLDGAHRAWIENTCPRDVMGPDRWKAVRRTKPPGTPRRVAEPHGACRRRPRLDREHVPAGRHGTRPVEAVRRTKPPGTPRRVAEPHGACRRRPRLDREHVPAGRHGTRPVEAVRRTKPPGTPRRVAEPHGACRRRPRLDREHVPAGHHGARPVEAVRRTRPASTPRGLARVRPTGRRQNCWPQ